MIGDIDKDGSGSIDFEEFLDMMTAKMVSVPRFVIFPSHVLQNYIFACIQIVISHGSHAPSPLQSDKDTREDIHKVFNLFDDDQTGHISLRNLKRVAKELGETMSDAELMEVRSGGGEVKFIF